MRISPLLFHKTLPLLILPVGLCLLLLAALIRWPRRRLAILPLTILGLFAWPPFADLLLGSLENRYPQQALEQCPVADAVFPLGGILTESSALSGIDEFNDAADRFERAITLYQAGRAPLLVLSNVNPPAPGAWGEGIRLRRMAISRGVPPASIILTTETINTATEADALAALAREHHWKRVLLVTSAFHMPRAMRLFRNAPAEIIPVPVGYQSGESHLRGGGFSPGRWMPQAEALFHSERALREYMGIAFYAFTR